MAPGAVWLRSDVERKTMFGVDEDDALPRRLQRRDERRDICAPARQGAARTAAAPPALIDATHAHAGERAGVAALAAECGVPFVGLWLDAPLDERLQRIVARRGDASDADEQVARAQQAEPLNERGWRARRRLGISPKTLATPALPRATASVYSSADFS